MSKRRRSRSHGRQGGGYGQGGQPGGQQHGGGGQQGGQGGYGGGGGGGRRGRGRYRRGGGGGGGGGPAGSIAGAGAVGMDGEGMRPPELESEIGENGEPIPLEAGNGVLEMHPNGYGFLRSAETNYTRERTDPFVPGTMIERYRLREGVFIKAMVQPGRRQQGPRVKEIVEVEGMAPDDYPKVKTFDQLTPINPEHWLRLETGQQPLTTRIMDLLTPLGKGQRALIVAPPRTGKTVLLQQVSQAVSTNHPELSLVMLLVDERPEEVTDMRRTVKGDVIASSLDCDVESHVRLSQLVIERCKRMAESGKDVFLLMDSITRMARAFNKWVGNTGRTMSGGVDIKALDIPKKLFATARVFEEGGSLTIVATALVDTGSRMDELIFQEFKGTGNMELVLDRKLSDRRVWPAIDISQSGTRREEKLLDPDTLHAVNMLRRTLSSMHHVDAMEQLTKQLAKFKSNREFISLIASSRE
jgi:transcription termination factor Rho